MKTKEELIQAVETFGSPYLSNYSKNCGNCRFYTQNIIYMPCPHQTKCVLEELIDVMEWLRGKQNAQTRAFRWNYKDESR